MDKKTKIVLISIAIIVLLLIFFFWIMVFGNRENTEPSGKTTLENKTAETENTGATIAPLITESGCQDIEAPDEKRICQNMELMGRAIANDDTQSCDRISNAEYRDHCLRIVSQTEKNVSGCRQIAAKEWENVCIMEIAYNSDDPAICGQIDYPYTKIKCKAQINSRRAKDNNNMDACLALPKASVFRNFCIWTLAEKNGVKICEAIKKAEDKYVCADWYYLNLAAENADTSICGKIQSVSYKKTCLKIVEAARSGSTMHFDSDNDGLNDLRELSMNLDPFSDDSDRDGVSDYVELFNYHSDPLNPDTDGDKRIDGEELGQGKDINVPD